MSDLLLAMAVIFSVILFSVGVLGTAIMLVASTVLLATQYPVASIMVIVLMFSALIIVAKIKDFF